MASKNILITGGSGLLGRHLTDALLKQGHKISHLSRQAGKNPDIKTFLWDVDKRRIDPACIDGIDTIVHLAGAGIANKPWTAERKKEIVESRTESIRLIYALMKQRSNHVKNIISASGINYYGDSGDKLLEEDDLPGNDFVANCCIEWEKAVDEGTEFGLRIVKFRTGVVLTKEGGALPKLAQPVKMYVGSPLGGGKQWVPWIHPKDVADMYLYALNTPQLAGTFNMVAPQPVTNKQLTHAVAKQLGKPLWAPNVPAFLIKLLFGEMAALVLGSTKGSAKKIQEHGFTFNYPDVESALREIYE